MAVFNIDPTSPDPLARSKLRYLQRLSASFWGVVVMSQVAFALPLAATFAYLRYQDDGHLSRSDVAYIWTVTAIGGLALAVPLWLFVAKPLTRARAELVHQRQSAAQEHATSSAKAESKIS